MEMTELLCFDFGEDCIRTARGDLYFWCVNPPNFSTLDTNDHELYYNQFEKLQRATADYQYSILAIDRTVSLSKNKEFIATLDGRFDYIKADLVNDLDQMESVAGNTQRGYYFVLNAKQRSLADRFEGILAAAGFDVAVADRQELIYIMRSFNLREFIDEDIFLDESEMELVFGKKRTVISPLVRHLLPTKINFDVSEVVQTNFLRKAFAVRNMPQSVTKGNNHMLKKLLQLPNTTVMIRISDMSYTQTRQLVNKQYNNSSAGLLRKKITDVLEAKGDANTLERFYEDCLNNSGEGGGVKCVNIFVETYGKTPEELKANVQRVTAASESSGMSLEDFVLRQKDGFMGVSPIGYDTRGRLLANNIPSNTFGRLYPFSSSYLNDVKGMMLGHTADNGVLILDIWVRTLTRTNSNIAICGDSGQGKSQLIKKILSQQRMLGTTIFNIDAENEFGDLVRTMGGTNINCATGKITINALQVRAFRSDKVDESDVEDDMGLAAFADDISPFFQHLSWLEDFFKVLLPDITSAQLASLLILLQDVYKRFGIDERTDLSTLAATNYPIMSDLYTYIEEVLDNREKFSFYKMIDDRDLKILMLLLTSVCKGSRSPQFNRHTNIPNSSFINLNIQELLMGSQDNMQAVLFNYFTYFWSVVVSRQSRVLLGIDELYLLANRDNPAILKYLNSFERRARKYLAGLLIGTQKIMDCLDEAIVHLTAALFDTPTYKFIFYPGDVDLDVVRRKLRLTSGEMSCIGHSEQRNCLLKIGKEKYHMTVGTLPFEEQLFGKGGGT